jgi:hypothetical protein
VGQQGRFFDATAIKKGTARRPFLLSHHVAWRASSNSHE